MAESIALAAVAWLAAAGPSAAAQTELSGPRPARPHPPRAGAAGEGLDRQAVRHRAPDADGPRGHRHVDHRVARVQRRPGVPVDGAADHLLVAAADDPRVRQPGRRPAGRALLDRPVRLRQALHDGADGQRRAVGGAADAGRAEGPEGDRRQRVGALEPRRRAHRQREAAAARGAGREVRGAGQERRDAGGRLARIQAARGARGLPPRDARRAPGHRPGLLERGHHARQDHHRGRGVVDAPAGRRDGPRQVVPAVGDDLAAGRRQGRPRDPPGRHAAHRLRPRLPRLLHRHAAPRLRAEAGRDRRTAGFARRA